MSRTRLAVAIAACVLAAPAAAHAAPIKGQYIVVLKSQASSAALSQSKARATDRGGTLQHQYSSVIKGFSAKLDSAALSAVRSDPNVAYVEQDQTVHLDTTETNATWGLDRIDQRSLPLDHNYNYTNTGAGVTAYIIDTGIRFSHQEFGGRAVSGYDAVDGGSADDCNGHGTHVSGTVGGSTYGVAKGVRLVAVRVLDCNGSGTNSGVIAGINWVTSNHVAGQPAVANMSLGGSASTAVDSAVQNSIADGVTYAIAAGNDSANACNDSPARVGAAITVGATTSSDARASFSNYGSCVDIFAPGNNITSSWDTSDAATNTISGTSMATPHVTGAAALVLQGAPADTPAQVAAALTGTATGGVVGNPGSGSPNLLLYTGSTGGGGGGGGTPTPTPSPTATPTPPPGCGTSYSGTLAGTGDSEAQPDGNYYQAGAGVERACLSGPAGADFDLYLYRWNGASWSRVAISDGSSSTESISYNGSAGYYYWAVVSYRGSGSYTLQISHP